MEIVEGTPIGVSYYPKDFWDDVRAFAENPILQRISANAANLDESSQEFVLAFIDALERASNGGDVDFDGRPGSFDSLLGALAQGLLTRDATARGRILRRFQALRVA